MASSGPAQLVDVGRSALVVLRARHERTIDVLLHEEVAGGKTST